MLTNTHVRNAKPKAKPYKLADTAGLYLFVRPSGSRHWRFDYTFLKKRKTLTIGTYPHVTLADARREREIAKTILHEGHDPMMQRKIDKLTTQTALADTFKTLADEYLNKCEKEGLDTTTLHKKRWLLSFAHPRIGTRPVSEITAPELLSILRTVETGGRYETARRLRSLFSQVFRYAIACGKAIRDPAADLRGALTAPKVTHHASITEPHKIGALLRAITHYDGALVTKYALQLAPLTFVRPGELRHGEWKEITETEWRIPAPKMKMPYPHVVPLSRQALNILSELRTLTGHGDYLFPSLRTSSRPMSENTVNAALRRLGYTTEEMTGHGFRSMASTRLNEMGFNSDWIERQLAHKETNNVRGAYNYAQHLTERKAMMQAWADYLDALRENKQPRTSK